MRQLLESQQEVRDPQEFIQNLKVELYPEEVYTFTPKGQVKAFPRGATPIDFAYSIHTDVGHQCVGARVNGKMVPLRTRLKNGDIVEIITQAGHKPSRDWLNFVVTSHARYKIKHLIRLEERARAIDLGRKVFEKEARRYDLNPKTLLESDAFAKALADFGVAEGRRSVRARSATASSSAEAGARQAGAGRAAAREGRRRARSPSAVKRVLGAGEEKIKVRGFDDLLVFRARCCNPIRGEKIVGYITRGKGVSVHSATCPNVVNLLYDPERRIDVEWDKARRDAGALHRQADDGGRGSEGGAGRGQREDRRHQHEHQEHGSAHRRDDQRARIDMTVEISDLKHLEKVIKSLRGRGRRAGRRAGRARAGAVRSGQAAALVSSTRDSNVGDDVDFDARVARQPRDLHGRARGIRLGEVRAVDLVHRREVVHVGEKDRRAHDVGERAGRRP